MTDTPNERPNRAGRDAFGRVQTDSELRRIDDLLSDVERAELTADLREMHERTHPCWEDR